MDNNPFFGETREAKFNAGLAKLQRIDTLKKFIHMHRMDRNFPALLDCLIGVRSELHERMRNGEREECDKHQRIINEFMTQTQGGKMNPFIVSQKLLNYELYLGELEYKFGMSMPNKARMEDNIGVD